MSGSIQGDIGRLPAAASASSSGKIPIYQNGVLTTVTPTQIATGSTGFIIASGEVIQFGATPTTVALLMGGGTSASPLALGATADKNAIGFWADSTATTGDTRLEYKRLYFSGAGGSGEVSRVFATVNNVTAATGGTVNGIHATLSVSGASGAISGAGNAIRATFAQGASNNAGGTCAVVQLDSDLDTAATVTSTLSYIRFTNSNTKKVPILMNLDGVDTSTLYIAAGTSAGSAGKSDGCAAQKVVQILVNGAACYIPVFTQNS